MKTGLVLGKFAPLHKGHQLLIETARRENDHVVVIIYDAPDITTIPLPVRADWISSLYPDVEMIEAWDGPLEIGDAPEIKKLHEDYLAKVLDGKVIDAFYSSEFYGEHVSKSLGAADRRIDMARSAFPVSATAIRSDLAANREYLDPLVYRDLLTKVVFLGAPSTGKSTLARECAEARSTVWVPEYGREYWEEHQIDRRLTPAQLVEVANGHRQCEDALATNANQVLFIDTDATTTYMFGKYYHGAVDDRLAKLADATLARYDLFFLCGTDIPYDDTWDRSGDANRLVFQQQIKADLLRRKIPFITLVGSVGERVKRVLAVLDQFDKFRSLGDNWSPM